MTLLLKLLVPILTLIVSLIPLAIKEKWLKLHDGRTKGHKRAVVILIGFLMFLTVITCAIVCADEKHAEKLAAKVEHKTQQLLDLAQTNVMLSANLVCLSDSNSKLTQKLAILNEERFRQLTMPAMNLIGIEEIESQGLDSYFKITAKNTGNNDCLDARLYIDRHNSPLADFCTIQSFTKVAKDSQVMFSIPMFRSAYWQVRDKKEQQALEESFVPGFRNGSIAIVVFFHFEYEWNGETLKSSQYSISKSAGNKAHCSSSEDYVEPQIDRSAWKWKK